MRYQSSARPERRLTARTYHSALLVANRAGPLHGSEESSRSAQWLHRCRMLIARHLGRQWFASGALTHSKDAGSLSGLAKIAPAVRLPSRTRPTGRAGAGPADRRRVGRAETAGPGAAPAIARRTLKEHAGEQVDLEDVGNPGAPVCAYPIGANIFMAITGAPNYSPSPGGCPTWPSPTTI